MGEKIDNNEMEILGPSDHKCLEYVCVCVCVYPCPSKASDSFHPNIFIHIHTDTIFNTLRNTAAPLLAM